MTQNSFGQRFGSAALLLLLPVLMQSAFADTASDATTFVNDEVRLGTTDAAINSDRAAMAADVAAGKALKSDVLQFFIDREAASGLHLLVAADRKELRKDIKFNPGKNGKPGKGTGNLQQDATTFIGDFDTLNTDEGNLDAAFQALQAATSNGNAAAITAAANTYFTNRHAAHLARLQLLVDVSALKKDVSFKGTGDIIKRKAGGLNTDVPIFLNDRATWKTDKDQVNADVNNIRGTLTAPSSLESSVIQLLTDAHSVFLDAAQLQIDRFIMRKDAGLKTGKERKADLPYKSNAENDDSEDGSLEISFIVVAK